MPSRQAAVDKDSKTKLDPLRNSQPVPIVKQRRHAFIPSCRVDHSCRRIEDQLESVWMPCQKTRQCSAAIVESSEFDETRQGTVANSTGLETERRRVAKHAGTDFEMWVFNIRANYQLNSRTEPRGIPRMPRCSKRRQWIKSIESERFFLTNVTLE